MKHCLFLGTYFKYVLFILSRYTINNVLDMWKEALQQIAPEMWKNLVRHAEDKIKEWWDREQLL
jgi:hypothetical protein